jgi:hypothetical protein
MASLTFDQEQLIRQLSEKMMKEPSFYSLLKTCSISKYGNISYGKTRRSKPAIWSKLIVPPASVVPSGTATTTDAAARRAQRADAAEARRAAGTGLHIGSVTSRSNSGASVTSSGASVTSSGASVTTPVTSSGASVTSLTTPVAVSGAPGAQGSRFDSSMGRAFDFGAGLFGRTRGATVAPAPALRLARSGGSRMKTKKNKSKAKKY